MKTFRSRCQEVFYRNCPLKKFAKFTGKYLLQNSSFYKGLGHACNVIKVRTPWQVFSWEFCEFPRAASLWNTSKGLLPNKLFTTQRHILSAFNLENIISAESMVSADCQKYFIMIFIQ